jgi:hypothetical protein
MNKKVIILIIVIFTGMFGYKLFSVKLQENKEKKVIQTQLSKEKESKSINENFKNKQVCETYRLKVINDLKIAEKNANYRINNYSGYDKDVEVSYGLEQLFYSPKQDSCLFSAIRTAKQNNKTNSFVYSLSDVFTGMENGSLIFEIYDVSQDETDYLKRIPDYWAEVDSYK